MKSQKRKAAEKRCYFLVNFRTSAAEWPLRIQPGWIRGGGDYIYIRSSMEEEEEEERGGDE